MLIGRSSERGTFAALLARARAGSAGVLHIVGDAGMGKTTLLNTCAADASDFHCIRSTAWQAETPVPFVVLAGLLRPLEPVCPLLPARLAPAAATALGRAAPGVVGELSLGMAVLALLAAAADRGPLLVIVDDLQWCDPESWRALSFALRRLAGERIAVLLASRSDAAYRLERAQTLQLTGLSPSQGQDLLRGECADVAAGVCAQLTAATGGHPLALVEALRALTAQQRSGRCPLPSSLPLPQSLQTFFAAQAATLTTQARQLMLLAAVEGHGDLAVLGEAAARAGFTLDVVAQVERAELLKIQDGRLVFRHPLIAASSLQSATGAELRAAHGILAAAHGGAGGQGVALLHAAAAALGPDSELAQALAQNAERQALSGASLTASRTYEYAARLTPQAELRAWRMTLGAEAALRAGAMDRADALAEQVEPALLPPKLAACPWLVRGRVAVLRGQPQLAAPLLVAAADVLEPRAAGAALAQAVEAALDMEDERFAARIVARAEKLPVVPADHVLGLHLALAQAALLAHSGAVDRAGAVLGLALAPLRHENQLLGDDGGSWIAFAQGLLTFGDVVGGRRAFVTAANLGRVGDDVGLLTDALSCRSSRRWSGPGRLPPRALACCAATHCWPGVRSIPSCSRNPSTGQTFADHALGHWNAAYAAGTQVLDLLEPAALPYQVAEVLHLLAEIDAARGRERSCRARCAQLVRGSRPASPDEDLDEVGDSRPEGMAIAQFDLGRAATLE